MKSEFEVSRSIAETQSDGHTPVEPTGITQHFRAAVFALLSIGSGLVRLALGFTRILAARVSVQKTVKRLGSCLYSAHAGASAVRCQLDQMEQRIAEASLVSPLRMVAKWQRNRLMYRLGRDALSAECDTEFHREREEAIAASHQLSVCKVEVLADLRRAVPESRTGQFYAVCWTLLAIATGIFWFARPVVPPATIDSISFAALSGPVDAGEPANAQRDGESRDTGVADDADHVEEHQEEKEFGKGGGRAHRIASSVRAMLYLAQLRREADRHPFLLNCTVVSDLGNDHYEIARGSHRAVLRAPMARVVRPGLLEIPVVQNGTMTVKLKNGFESELPLLVQAMSRTGAAGMSVEDAIASRADVNERLRKARLDVAVAALKERFSGSDVQSLARHTGADADFNQSDLSDVLGILRTAAQDGFSPIHVATHEGDAELLRSLLASGERPAVLTRDGITTTNVAVAAHFRRLPVLASLLDVLAEAGMEIDQQDRNGRSAVHLAVSLKSEELLRFLAKRGMGLNRPDDRGSTPVHAAAAANSPLLKVLIELGANAGIQNRDGETPLHVACERPKLTTVRMLVQTGLDVNARDRQGRTALHVCVTGSFRNAIDVARVLLEAGADASLRDHAGNTAATLTKSELLRAELIVKRRVTIPHPNATIEFVPDGLIASWNERAAETYVATFTLVGEQKWKKQFDAETAGHFVVNSNGMSFCSIPGRTTETVTCLNSNGEVVWSASLPGRIDFIVPDSKGGFRCVVGDTLHCVNQAGELQWKATLGTPVAPIVPTVAHDGTTYLTGEDEKGQDGLLSITASGQRRWCFVPHRGVVRTLMRPLVSPNGTVYAIFGTGSTIGAKLHAISPDGRGMWDATVGTGGAGVLCRDGSLLLATDGVYAIAAHGQKRWHAQSSCATAPLVTAHGTVYIIDQLGTLVRYKRDGVKETQVSLALPANITRARLGAGESIELICADGTILGIDCNSW